MNPGFRDMLSASNGAGVAFLVVGAFALAAHGLPRAAGAIDIWVRPSLENAERLARGPCFWGPGAGVDAHDFTVPDIVFQIGVAPRRIDILTSMSGVSFGEAWGERVTVVQGLALCVLGRRHLIASKKAAARPRDVADVAWQEREGS